MIGSAERGAGGDKQLEGLPSDKIERRVIVADSLPAYRKLASLFSENGLGQFAVTRSRATLPPLEEGEIRINIRGAREVFPGTNSSWNKFNSIASFIDIVNSSGNDSPTEQKQTAIAYIIKEGLAIELAKREASGLPSFPESEAGQSHAAWEDIRRRQADLDRYVSTAYVKRREI